MEAVNALADDVVDADVERLFNRFFDSPERIECLLIGINDVELGISDEHVGLNAVQTGTHSVGRRLQETDLSPVGP